MGCFQDIHPARVYHCPKDDVSRELTSPLLSRSVLVRRSTGDVSSGALYLHREALLEALEAFPDLRILWLTGVRIQGGDVNVLQNLASYSFSDLLDALKKGPPPERKREWCHRILSTLIRKNVLEWRVAIPKGEGVFHEKGAIFSDPCGHNVLLTGSWNETLAAYERNVERVDVHKGWEDVARCREAIDWFDSVWHGKERGMRVLPVNEAIKQGLIAEVEDETWPSIERREVDPSKWTPELLFLAIQDKVPWALKDPYIGTLVKPLPHQVHVHRRILSRPPARFLLADEVGLGKTIEAGLVLSTLVATGLARRVLVIAPAHVLKQWDEELREKFRLDPWTFRSNTWVNEDRGLRIPASRPLFLHLPGSPPHVVLVSQAIASRRERRSDFESSSWDLVILDEAHRARGRWEGPVYKKNNLLRTLDSLALRTASLLLLTATPVQLRLGELYDLLSPLGLPPGWIDRKRFDGFLEQLNQENPDWRTLFEMARGSASYYRELYGLSVEKFEEDLASGVRFFDISGMSPKRAFQRCLETVESQALYEVETFSREEKNLLRVVLYRMSPIYQLTCRNTRNLLRRYYEAGLIAFRVPNRALDDPIAIRFTEEERALYEAVEKEYVRPFYHDYGEVGLPTHGVGFILTIYRKRAASGWRALRKSLERRRGRLDEALSDWGFHSLKRLFGSLAAPDLASEGAEEEDKEVELEGQEEALEDAALEGLDLSPIREVVVRERAKVNELVGRLEDLEGMDVDSKRDALLEHVRGAMGERRGMIIFSQYKDTVDSLANPLYRAFGASLAKYYGKGGEVREEGRWKSVSKSYVENLVQAGSLQVLVATDAASEGLNLQEMDGIVNYDLPWNPMRIEQRIGRIDRITQESPVIRVGALVPEETIEMEVYDRCLHRLNLFRQSMGPLQPVLVEDFVKDVVLEGGDVDKSWERMEEEWNTAKKHAELLEKAMSAQTLKSGWAERKAIEAAALEHLLAMVGYHRENGVWRRGEHALAVQESGKGIQRVTAIPHDPVFLSLLPELGPIPETLSWSGLEYKILDAEGSKVLAVKHPDGGVCIVKDLSDIEARESIQVGRNYEDARQHALRLERGRKRSYERFVRRQKEVRLRTWRADVERRVLEPLMRWAGRSVEKATSEILRNEILGRVARRYVGSEDALIHSEAKALLGRFAGRKKKRGRRPSLEQIVRNAMELMEEP